MSRPREGMLDEVAREVADWLADEPEIFVDMFRAGGRAPFAAPAGPRELHDFYESQFFLPDGSPNEVGRKQTLQRVGLKSYAEILERLLKEHEGGLPSPESPAHRTYGSWPGNPPIPGAEDEEVA